MIFFADHSHGGDAGVNDDEECSYFCLFPPLPPTWEVLQEARAWKEKGGQCAISSRGIVNEKVIADSVEICLKGMQGSTSLIFCVTRCCFSNLHCVEQEGPKFCHGSRWGQSLVLYGRYPRCARSHNQNIYPMTRELPGVALVIFSKEYTFIGNCNKFI